MKKAEADKLLDDVTRHFSKRGLPINIRDATDTKVAEFMRGVISGLIVLDEPLGVEQGYDYDLCPKCGSVAGSRSYYCKMCGAYLREK